MPTSIEVRYLSHNDLGKTIQLHGRYAGLAGTLDGLETSRSDTPYILLDLEFERGHKQMYDFHPSDRVTITGQPSPATDDPHGQRYTTPEPVGPRRAPATGPMGDRQEIAKAAIDHTYGQPHAGKDQAQQLPAPNPQHCPCFGPAWHGHYDPACPDYCDRCNYNNHI